MAQVLIVDDESLVRSTLQLVLTKAGHTVRTAANGGDALASFVAHRPDLIITDIVMPRVNGIELIQSVHTQAPELPIIAISGSDPSHNFELLQKARKAGARHLLPKPFTKNDLLEVVGSCLNSLLH
jgi:YesN/AraC family two-component response regulator